MRVVNKQTELDISVVRGVRGVGGVCEMCKCLAQGGVGCEG